MCLGSRKKSEFEDHIFIRKMEINISNMESSLNQRRQIKKLALLLWKTKNTHTDTQLSRSVQFSSVPQSCLFAAPWTAAHQASQSITKSRSLLKLMSIESVMPSNHLILCGPLLLLSMFPSIRVFSNESILPIRWPKYWSFSFSIRHSNEHPGLISFRMGWLDLLAVQGLSRVFSNTTVQKHQSFSAQFSLWSCSHIHTWLLVNQ